MQTIRRAVMVFLAVVLSLAAFPYNALAEARLPSQDAPPREMYVDHCESYVSLRKRPDTGSTRLCKVPYGAKVVLLDLSDQDIDGFAWVSYDGVAGYILIDYLEYEPPTDQSQQRVTFSYSASSTLSAQTDISYGASNLRDGDHSTAWVEGVRGVGCGEAITITASERVSLYGFDIYAGYGKSADIYNKNARVKAMQVYADGANIGEFFLDDVRQMQRVEFSETVYAKEFSFVITEVYYGSMYDDTCISELDILWY